MICISINHQLVNAVFTYLYVSSTTIVVIKVLREMECIMAAGENFKAAMDQSLIKVEHKCRLLHLLREEA